jgi:hypothetical protein
VSFTEGTDIAAGPFYFAWCLPHELTDYGPQHYRTDEEIFNLEVSHAEGEFPAATIEIRNPRVGLLGPGRKVWAWISWRDPAGAVHPLFFGRLVGIPEEIENETVRLTFVARPRDYYAQRV